ncbi:hypothetical protein SMICM17S_04676 [Streptomyces microflavus]
MGRRGGVRRGGEPSGWIPRRRHGIRRGVLRHPTGRGTADGPAAADRPGGGVRRGRGRAAFPSESRGHPHRRLHGRDVAGVPAVHAGRRRGDPRTLGHRLGQLGDPVPHCLRAGAARPRDGRGDRVELLLGRGAPRRAEPALRRVGLRPCRRRQPDAASEHLGGPDETRHTEPGRPEPGLRRRRRRLRSGRGLRGGRAAPAVRRARRRRPRLRAGARQRRQQRRRDGRTDRPQPRGADGGAAVGVGERRRRAECGVVRRGARHGHAPGRRDGGGRARHRVRARPARAVTHRLGEDELRPPRTGGRRARARQGRAGGAPRRHSAEPALPHTEPAHRLPRRTS